MPTPFSLSWNLYPLLLSLRSKSHLPAKPKSRLFTRHCSPVSPPVTRVKVLLLHRLFPPSRQGYSDHCYQGEEKRGEGRGEEGKEERKDRWRERKGKEGESKKKKILEYTASLLYILLHHQLPPFYLIYLLTSPKFVPISVPLVLPTHS